MQVTSPVTAAPGGLEFVREFVNTLDIESGVDRLGSVTAWRAWARAHDIRGSVTEQDLGDARVLREALRVGMLANHDREPMPAATASALTEVAALADLSVRFDSHQARLVTPAPGIRGLYGRVVAAVADAMDDGTWSRLKACVNDSCRWGFYDASRSRTGQWCAMEICGNRAKQARWRESSRS